MNFEQTLASCGQSPLKPASIDIFQINVGKFCNMTCAHCHVDAGPARTEMMTRETAQACLRALDSLPSAKTVDITGGAPELNPNFRYLVEESIRRGKHVMDRCNLSVLLLPRSQGLTEWLAEKGVEIVCSLPHYRKFNTDMQRGEGAYANSIEALKKLNTAGYGKGDPALKLTLVSNPAGAYLAASQAEMEKEWKAALLENHGVTFDRLITINNMPISRFLKWLKASGNLESYMTLLTNAFNPATVEGLMCRNTLSIGWDGRVYDCDFNQMLEMDSRYPDGGGIHIENLDAAKLAQRSILTGTHCYGCTAGAGSSCGGAIAN